jgi:ADP-ribose pyrophosphatase YjhB (NUDIX family)
MAKEYPTHPIPSCNALVCDGERFLLIQRGRPPFQGYWSLPGGGVELGETIAQALVREVREETGLAVEPGRFLGYADAINHDAAGRVQFHYLIMHFEVQLIGGELQVGDDAADARWVTPAEARGLLITDTVERALAWAGL